MLSPQFTKGGTMPISEDEAERLISHIEATVRRVTRDPSMSGITGLIDQWKADVEAGRSIERKLRFRASRGFDDLTDTPRSGLTTSGDFVGKEDFTRVEQLDMLVVSLRLAFLVPSMMSARLLDTIAEYCGEQDQQEKKELVVQLFGVSTTDVAPTSPSISREMIARSNEVTAKLATLLDEIIREAEFTPERLIDGEDIV